MKSIQNTGETKGDSEALMNRPRPQPSTGLDREEIKQMMALLTELIDEQLITLEEAAKRAGMTTEEFVSLQQSSGG